MYRDPENSGNAGQFLAAAKSWERVSRRNSARCGLGAAEAARRSGDTERVRHDPAHPRARVPRVRPAAAAPAGRTRCCGCSASPVRPHTGTAIPPLTAAQVEVLDLVGRGLDTHAIARRLVVSDATVETHVRQSMQRLGASTRLAAAVELLRRRGDLSPDATARSADRRRRRTAVRLPEDGHRRRGPAGRPLALDPTMIASIVVRDSDDAARAVIVAARGASLVLGIDGSLPQDARAELLDALARIGPLQRLEPVAPTVTVEADEAMRDALEVLANGGTVAEAAYAVHMSERTLHRRLSTLRKQLGLRSNTAVAREVLGSGTS